MDKYLLDTNAYFKIISDLRSPESCNGTIQTIINNEVYISKLTEIEIISVIGKYARGESEQKQLCERQIIGSDNRCNHIYYKPGRKKWPNKLTAEWLRLVKNISEGNSPLFKINVLDVDEEVIRSAQQFVKHALQFNFRSMDAMIAATAQRYSTSESKITVVTADKALIAGMKVIKMPFIKL